VHKESGRSYNVKFAPPRVAGLDDVTGEPLMQRADDTAAAVVTRLAAFREQTSPVLDFYRSRGLLREVDADRPIGIHKTKVLGLARSQPTAQHSAALPGIPLIEEGLPKLRPTRAHIPLHLMDQMTELPALIRD
jgi:hypothetical protein